MIPSNNRRSYEVNLITTTKTPSLTQKPQNIQSEDLRAHFKEARKLLKEKQNLGIVGSDDEDALAKNYKKELKILKKEFRALTSLQQHRPMSSVWNVIYFFFPVSRPSYVDHSWLLFNIWDRVTKTRLHFLRISESRDRTLTACAFTRAPNTILGFALPTSNAVNRFTDHLRFRVIQRVTIREPIASSNVYQVSDEAVSKWWDGGWAGEVNNNGDDTADTRYLLKHASRKIIFMMDETKSLMDGQCLNQITEMLEEAKKLLLLLMRFTMIPEASSCIGKLLRDYIVVLYNICKAICMLQQMSINTKFSRFSDFPSVPDDLSQKIEDFMNNNRVILDNVIRAAIDRRAEHWQLLLRQDSPVSVAPLVSMPFDYFGEELHALFDAAQTSEGPTINEIALDQDRRTSERINRPQPDHDESQEEIKAFDRDTLITELENLGLRHIMVYQEAFAESFLSSGRFGNVYKTYRHGQKNRNNPLAVKVVYEGKGSGKQTTSKRILQEAEVWNKLQMKARTRQQSDGRRLINPLLGYTLLLEHPFPGLVSPYLPDECLKVYIAHNQPQLPERLNLLLDVAHALKFLHSEYVVHADLRSENILVDTSGHAVLCDFGMSVQLPSFDVDDRQSYHEWLAPELLTFENSRLPSKKSQSDVYAFGVVCVEVESGKVPTREEQISVYHARRAIPAAIYGIHHGIWNLVTDCWKLDPYARPIASALITRLELLLNNS